VAYPSRSGGRLRRRVVRGGSWNNNPTNVRAAIRNHNPTDNRNNNVGVRVVWSHGFQRGSPTAARHHARILRRPRLAQRGF